MTLDGTAIVHIGDHIIVDPREGCAEPELSVESSITETINRLISLKGIEAKDQHGRSALALAAARGQERVVEFLLRLGADVDSLDSSGMTPLLWACRRPLSRQIYTGPLTVLGNAKVSQGLSIGFRGEAHIFYLLGILERSYSSRARIVASMLSKSTPKVWFNGRGETAMLLALAAGRRDIFSMLYSESPYRMAESDFPIAPSTYYSDESGVAHRGIKQMYGFPAADARARINYPRSVWFVTLLNNTTAN